MPGCNWQLGLGPLALDWKKLHRLAGPTPLGVSAATGKSRNADAKVGGQKLADAKTGGLRSGDQRGQVRSPN